MGYSQKPLAPQPDTDRQQPPQPPIMADTLNRFGGHVLVPERAGTVRGRRVNPTAYVGNELLVQGSLRQDSLATLIEAARSTGHEIGASGTAPQKRKDYIDTLTETALSELADKVWVTRFRLRTDPESTSPPPDAWTVLQKYRELVGEDEPEVTVGLNHLISLTGDIHGQPYVTGPSAGGVPYVTGPGGGGVPYVTGPGTGGVPYVTGPGLGGRAPVTWLGLPPTPVASAVQTRRPVVAVLDTGLGKHDWLEAPHATLGAVVNGHTIGLPLQVPDAESEGIADELQGGLDRDAGHGTFIAGIIRQVCPDATVLAIRVMPSGGVVDEHQLTIALNMLLVRQAHAQLTGEINGVIDVLSLSLGYYHETPDDVQFSGVLGGTLQSFGELGVAVVTAAGNDATTTPMFPAGLASRTRGTDQRRDAIPLVSVGALNPSGTIAIFSNAGDWVSCHRPGSNVVSTIPTTFDGSLQPQVATRDGRSSIDPDNYTSGFGIWSGTSFAAPVLAAEIAGRLLESGTLDDISPASGVTRGWQAIHDQVGWVRP